MLTLHHDTCNSCLLPWTGWRTDPKKKFFFGNSFSHEFKKLAVSPLLVPPCSFTRFCSGKKVNWKLSIFCFQHYEGNKKSRWLFPMSTSWYVSWDWGKCTDMVSFSSAKMWHSHFPCQTAIEITWPPLAIVEGYWVGLSSSKFKAKVIASQVQLQKLRRRFLYIQDHFHVKI